MSKIYFTFFALLPLIFVCACTQKKEKAGQANFEKHKAGYKILEIDSILDLYIIYAQKKDSLIKILSTKSDSVSPCDPIAIGEFYDLKVHSSLGNRVQKNEVSYLKYKNALIKLGEKGSIWDLFWTDNLNGTCYQQ